MTKVILVIDDSTSIRKMVSFILRGAGYEVIEAIDGLDGLEKAKVNSVHLVLTDQNMPRMDGVELVRQLRAQAQHKTTPILMSTTDTSDAMRAQGRTAGVTGLLVKPFEPQKLIDLVRQVIG